MRWLLLVDTWPCPRAGMGTPAASVLPSRLVRMSAAFSSSCKVAMILFLFGVIVSESVWMVVLGK